MGKCRSLCGGGGAPTSAWNGAFSNTPKDNESSKEVFEIVGVDVVEYISHLNYREGNL